MNDINGTEFETEKNIVYFKWYKPENPNGIIFKYNIKLVDALTNKVYSSEDRLIIFLNSSLLSRHKVHYVTQRLTI